jgi:hypothetical protein
MLQLIVRFTDINDRGTFQAFAPADLAAALWSRRSSGSRTVRVHDRPGQSRAAELAEMAGGGERQHVSRYARQS